MTTFFWIIEYIASFIEIFMCCVFCGTFLVKEEFGDRKYLAFAGAALSALLITGLNKIEIFSVFNSIFVLFVIILFSFSHHHPPSFSFQMLSTVVESSLSHLADSSEGL